MEFCYESLIWKEACPFLLLVFSPIFLFSGVCCSFSDHKTIRRRHEQLNFVSFDVLFPSFFHSFFLSFFFFFFFPFISFLFPFTGNFAPLKMENEKFKIANRFHSHRSPSPCKRASKSRLTGERKLTKGEPSGSEFF